MREVRQTMKVTVEYKNNEITQYNIDQFEDVL